MVVIRIARRYRSKHSSNPICANLMCQAPLERPFAIHEFFIGQSRKTYRRPFCVDCTERMNSAKADEVIVEVLG